MKLIIPFVIITSLVLAQAPTPSQSGSVAVPTQVDQDKATIKALQLTVLNLQEQLVNSQRSVLAAQACSEAGLVWKDCNVDPSTMTASPRKPITTTGNASPGNINLDLKDKPEGKPLDAKAK